ncbi:MAG TPA: hypothetical protein ENO14_05130, partial [Chromatiales bacterium]|nr:hypothetical protein [Chromatiales bacterium]
MNLLKKLFKPKSERDFARAQPIIDVINQHAEEYAGFTEAQFKAKTAEFKERIAGGETINDLMPEAFGLVKAACQT